MSYTFSETGVLWEVKYRLEMQASTENWGVPCMVRAHVLKPLHEYKMDHLIERSKGKIKNLQSDISDEANLLADLEAELPKKNRATTNAIRASAATAYVFCTPILIEPESKTVVPALLTLGLSVIFKIAYNSHVKNKRNSIEEMTNEITSETRRVKILERAKENVGQPLYRQRGLL